MSRLNTELWRLFGPMNAAVLPAAPPPLLHEAQCTRALLIELRCPLDWRDVARLGVAIEAELGLPAPALAVNGRDAYQLWFSLARPEPLAQAEAFVAGLKQRYLPDKAAAAVRLWPSTEYGAAEMNGPPALPPCRLASGDWAAFVAPDLAPMFVDTPWLDMPPREDGQAELLARANCIQANDFSRVLALLTPSDQAEKGEGEGEQVDQADAPAMVNEPIHKPDPYAHVAADPVRFLQAVMADARAPLALRIEAAKALLPLNRQALGPTLGPLMP